MINKEQVKHISGLAKLKYTEKETVEFINEFSSILNYLEKLKGIDLDNVEPLYQIYDYNQVFRDDIAEEGLSRDEVLQNTVEKQYGYFKLLNIMD